jgi:hypothetical protein
MTQAANLGALGTNAGTTGILASTGGGTGTTAGVTGFKNRIINGAMLLNQRGFSGTVTADGNYGLDRWQMFSSASSKYSLSQSSDAPAGFINSILVTSLATTSVGATDYYYLRQCVEGLNCTDLSWGTANAKTVTLSFWVKSSLTGTFGGTLENNAQNRSYPISYTISAANTWEYKSVTVAGDTTGTWLTTNGIGIMVQFGLGVGSTYSDTAGAWTSKASAWSATGATSVVGTNGATFYITGVQLEVGTAATNFDVRSYTTELQLCQRYFVRLINGNGQELGSGWNYESSQLSGLLYAPVSMRATPSIISSSGTDYYIFYRNGAGDTFNSLTIELSNATNNVVSYYNNSQISGTAGQCGLVRSNNASASVALSSEL